MCGSLTAEWHEEFNLFSISKSLSITRQWQVNRNILLPETGILSDMNQNKNKIF
jgi:hypothetical protein